MTLGVPDLDTPRPTPGDPVLDRVRSFWDLDAAGYDHEATHHPATAAKRAAWSAALHRHLPRSTARILDVGAGTGFLSLMAASLGHRVTALDLSSAMLSRLQTKAEAAGLSVETVHGTAHEPPAGPSTPSSRATCCGPSPAATGSHLVAGDGAVRWPTPALRGHVETRRPRRGGATAGPSRDAAPAPASQRPSRRLRPGPPGLSAVGGAVIPRRW